MRISRLLTRYLALFILVFLVPFAALGFFIDRYLLAELRRNAREAQCREIEQDVAILDSRLAELDQLWVQISSDSDFRPFVLREDPFRAYLVIKELGKYTYPNNFIDALFIGFRNDSFLYSASSAQSVRYFLDTMPSASTDTIPADELEEILFMSTQKRVWSRGGHVYVSIPFPSGIRNAPGTLLFRISQTTLLSYLDSDRVESIEIRGPDGTVLARTGPDQRSAPVVYGSEQSGWSYFSVIREELIAADVRPVRLMFGYSMIGLLVVGMVTAAAAGLATYSPIRKLRRFFEREAPTERAELGEMEFIRARFEEVLAEEESLREQIRHEQPLLREAVITRLLNGTIEEPQTLAEIGLEIHPHTYVVAVAAFADEPPPAAQTALAASDGLGNVAVIYLAALWASRLIIIASSRHGGIEAITGFLTEVRRSWETSCRTTFALACSSAKSDLTNAGEAYMEALEALSHRIAKRANAFIRYEDIQTTGDTHRAYPYDEVGRLHTAVAAGSPEGMSVSIERIIDRIESEELGVADVRRLYFNVMNTIATGVRERSGSHRDELPFPDVFLLERVGSRDELITLLRETTVRVRQTLEAGMHSRPRYIDELKDYLDSEYQDPNLSLVGLAERFRLTPPHLSTTFKRHMGINISDYISKLRLKKAAELLRCSDLPIKAIVHAAGYTDSSSFIRKFKAANGVTPGEFRRLQDSVPPGKACFQ